MIELSVCRSTAELLALRDDWTALLERDARATVFQTWEWNVAWWSAYCRSGLKVRLNAELHVIVARSGGELVGLFPLWRSRRRKAVRFLGEHVTDYLMPVVHETHAEPVLAAFAERLSALASRDTVDLLDLPDDHPLLERFPGAVRPGVACPRIALEAGAEELLKGISSNLRHSIRKGDRELIQSGRGSFSDADGRTWRALLESFEGLYCSRAEVKGRRTVLNDPNRPRFWRLFFENAVPRGLARLKLLEVDGSAACGVLCFHYKGVCSYYAQGMDPKFASFAPGNLTLWRAVEDAIADGCHTFDFLRGEEEFKARWRPETRHNAELHLP